MAEVTDIEHYEILSIGAGPAGKFVPWTSGKKGAIIEREYIAGSCPQVACLPTKNIIFSAGVVKLGNHGTDFGLTTSSGGTDMKAVRKRKEDMIYGSDGLVPFHEYMNKVTGTELIWGNARFVDKKTVAVFDNEGKKLRTVHADVIVLSTGSTARIQDLPGLKESEPMTHIEMLNTEELPQQLIIIGAGYVGLEFAQAMQRFGTQVTVLDRHDKVLKREDDDVATFLRQKLESEGVVFRTNVQIKQVSGKSGEGVKIEGVTAGEPFEIEGSHILVATGRIPNTTGLGLEVAGVETTAEGFIKVDENNLTNIKGIYAAGDCAGSPLFTHIGLDDFRIIRDHLAQKANVPHNRRSGRQVPFTLFTDPEFGHVGLREHEAKAKGVAYRKGEIPMSMSLRTRTVGQTEGFMKVLVAADDTIIGFSAVGVHAGEILPVVGLAMRTGVKYYDLADLIIAHPTFNEGLTSALMAVPSA